MTALVNRHTQAPVRFVGGLSLLIRAFEDVYGNLEGQTSGGPRTSLCRECSHLHLSDDRRGSAGMAEERFR